MREGVPGETEPRPEDRRFLRWLCLLAALHVILGLLLYEPTLFPGGDNAGYMILGESLRSGAGYRDLYLPGEPLHTKYPPAYPAILALLGWGGVQLFKMASLAFTTGAVALTGLLGRRVAGPLPGLAAAGLLAVNPVLLEYSHYVLSEAPFLFFVLAALLLLASEGKRQRAVGLGAAALAFFTRTAGLPLLLAAALLPTLERRGRRAAAAWGTALAAAAGWGAYQRAAAPGAPGYLQELLLRNPYDPEAGGVGMADLLARTAGNVWDYLASVLPEALTGAPAEEGLLLPALGLVVAGLALGGWVSRATSRLGYPELFAALYAGLISLWPAVWTDRRFLLPLLPLLFLYAAVGAAAVAGAFLGRRRRSDGETVFAPGREARRGGLARARHAAVVLMALLLAGAALAWAAAAAPERVRCVARYRSGAPCDPPALASFYEAARWARTHTEPDAVIANRKPTLFYWYSRRKGDVYRYSAEPSLVMRSLEEMGASYVVVDQVSATTPRYLVPAIRAHAERFELVYEGGEPPSAILRLRPLPETAGNPPREARPDQVADGADGAQPGGRGPEGGDRRARRGTGGGTNGGTGLGEGA